MFSAIFTLVNAALLRPLPYPQSDRLVWFTWDIGGRSAMTGVTDLEAEYWSARTHAFEAIATFDGNTANLAAGAEPAEQAMAQHVSHDFFRVLGVQPALGRDFSKEDDRPNGPRVAVISHGLWQRRFGGRPDVLGLTLTVDDVPYTVVGVLPATCSESHHSTLTSSRSLSSCCSSSRCWRAICPPCGRAGWIRRGRCEARRECSSSARL